MRYRGGGGEKKKNLLECPKCLTLILRKAGEDVEQ